jgi:hypothetical protein
VDEGRGLRTYLKRCKDHQVDAQEAERALFAARFDVKTGRVHGRDPFRLAWRRLQQGQREQSP